LNLAAGLRERFKNSSDEDFYFACSLVHAAGDLLADSPEDAFPFSAGLVDPVAVSDCRTDHRPGLQTCQCYTIISFQDFIKGLGGLSSSGLR
jgi:hypothetical protein